MNAQTPSALPGSSRTPGSAARPRQPETEAQPPRDGIKEKEVPLSGASDQTDFFLVLEGHCYLNLPVKITFDQSDSLRYIAKKMRQAELESETLESSREEARGAN